MFFLARPVQIVARHRNREAHGAHRSARRARRQVADGRQVRQVACASAAVAVPTVRDGTMHLIKGILEKHG